MVMSRSDGTSAGRSPAEIPTEVAGAGTRRDAAAVARARPGPAACAAGVCMLAVVAGAFLPWLSVLDTRVAGIAGDGKITLACALISLAALAAHAGVVPVLRLPTSCYLAVSYAGVVVTNAIAFEDLSRFAAAGLNLTAAAGLVWTATLAWELDARVRTRHHRNRPLGPA